jgi:two-component system cell cycle response regulator DivK
MHVLLAEDNPDNREMLARRLQRRGFTVDCAEDGALAVAAATRRKPDLVLMDVSMPVMSGLEATRALRAQPQTADLKIIALTAHAMASARDECMDAGCDAFATKPVDFASLLETIAKVTGRKLPQSA